MFIIHPDLPKQDVDLSNGAVMSIILHFKTKIVDRKLRIFLKNFFSGLFISKTLPISSPGLNLVNLVHPLIKNLLYPSNTYIAKLVEQTVAGFQFTANK